MKGADLIAEPLILRLETMPGISELSPWQENLEGNHLFFLVLNPDRKTVGMYGNHYDLKEVGNTYTFLIDRLRVIASESHDKSAFLQEVTAIIGDQGQ